MASVTVTISGTTGTFCSGTSCPTFFDGSYVLTYDDTGTACSFNAGCGTIAGFGNCCHFGQSPVNGDDWFINTCGINGYYIGAWIADNGTNLQWVVRLSSRFIAGTNLVFYVGSASSTTPCADRPVTMNKTGLCTSGTCTFPATITLT